MPGLLVDLLTVVEDLDLPAGVPVLWGNEANRAVQVFGVPLCQGSCRTV